MYIHVTLVPFLSGSNEYKSKPTQHSVKELQGMGISPDVIVLRSDGELEQGLIRKIAMFCNVQLDCVIPNLTLPCLYQAPLMLEEAGLGRAVVRRLGLPDVAPDLQEWERMVRSMKNPRMSVSIGLVGKYVQLHDAYLSVAEALRHAGYLLGAQVEIDWIDSEHITPENVAKTLGGHAGIIVPGGFGDRGIEGMVTAARWARENKVPYLGICLGMQIAVIEFARHVAGIEDACSGEFDPAGAHKVIDFMPDQSDEVDKGGTLRLGAYPCVITPGTMMERSYGLGTQVIHERHRHRYEFNNEYREQLTAAGLLICGQSPDGRLVEAVEVGEHPFFVGVQYHPEFKSRPNRPHPLFVGFIGAALDSGGADAREALASLTAAVKARS